MWNKRISPLLYIRVYARGWKKGIRLWLFLFPLAICRLLFSLDGLLGLVGGKPGRMARNAVNSVNGILLSLMCHEPLTLADIAYQDPKQKACVQVRTLGFGIRKETK